MKKTVLAHSITTVLILAATFAWGSSWHCDIVSLRSILENNPEISFRLCQGKIPFKYKELPLTDYHFLHPHEGTFFQTFVLTIPHGLVFGLEGWVLVNNTLISELIWQNVYLSRDVLEAAKQNPVMHKKGRVAVITQSGYSYYYHWMVEVLGRLALLELQGIEFDFLYVPNTAPYMLQTLELWGIDPQKIIIASDSTLITADELIVPSLVSLAEVQGLPRLVHYIPAYLVEYIRTKLLTAYATSHPEKKFHKKIFISRQDATARKISNEDEIYAILASHGFERYHLTTLNFLDQINLFSNAEIIISSLGSGLTNILFCNPQVTLCELYQARRDATIWNLSQMIGIKDHRCIKTTDFIDEREGQYDTYMPPFIIQELMVSL